MTEEEAKTKWCPFARVAAGVMDDRTSAFIGVAGSNRVALSERVKTHGGLDKSNPESARCIGSACMAWREATVSERVPHSTGAGPDPIIETRVGYCGIAGKP